MIQVRRIRRPIVITALALVLLPGLFVGTRLGESNFGTVAPGRIYRSGQMTAGTLARTVRRFEIKTVLNLRGDNPKLAWYRAERSATLSSGANQLDVHMASDLWLSRHEARTLVRLLDTSEYPLLIHCEWGAERTGLVSAIATLLRPGGSLADAQRQFSLYYLFVRAGDGKVMAEHLDLYERWLRASGLSHSPGRFRQWITQVYMPAGASREDWQFDPYPPFIISRPPAEVGQSGNSPGIRK
jgi:hypothetical protein